MTELMGVYPVLSTPFDDEDRIDMPVLRREIDWVLGAGADGVTIAMVSEILRLDPLERMLLGDAAIDASGGRPVILSITAESTAQSLHLARHAVENGATATMASPPLTSTLRVREAIEHFRRLADATGGLPLVIQDPSGYIGPPLPLVVMMTLLDEYGETKIQFKPEAEPLGPSLSVLLEASGSRARVFEGSGGRALLDCHRRGIVGTMPGADLVWAIVVFWRALEEGQDDLAFAIQSGLTSILSHVSSLDSYIAVEKHLLVQQGVFDSVRQRGPASYSVDDETGRQLEDLLVRLRTSITDLSTGRSKP